MPNAFEDGGQRMGCQPSTGGRHYVSHLDQLDGRCRVYHAMAVMTRQITWPVIWLRLIFMDGGE
jgi:hypothetical protein